MTDEFVSEKDLLLAEERCQVIAKAKEETGEPVMVSKSDWPGYNWRSDVTSAPTW